MTLNSASFVVGEVYFRIKYAELEQRYPLIDSFVFVGKNLPDEGQEDTWYFQFADSYGKYGSVVGTSGGDRRVACVAANELKEMLDAQGLMDELAEALKRRTK